jgi:hypothetical protein
MNIRNTAKTVAAIGNLISKELANANSDNVIDNTNGINKVRDEIELLSVISDISQLKDSLITSCNALAKSSSQLYLASESSFQAYAETVDAYDRSDGSFEDQKESNDAEKTYEDSKKIFDDYKVKLIQNISELESSLGDFKRAVVSHEYKGGSSLSL